MLSRWSRRARCAAAERACRFASLLLCAAALGGCVTNGQYAGSAAALQGATVAFDQIDGLPRAQFDKLVQKLNDEAQTRRLAVLSRESASAYRVRGTIAATVERNRTVISWTWDVVDKDDRRALRITGAEAVKGRHRDGWAAADDAVLKRIAGSSMDQLAAFLTSPEALQAAGQPVGFTLASATADPSSPESAGIFRIFQSKADPASSQADEPGDAETVADADGAVPLPRRRPAAGAFISAGTAKIAANGG